MKGKQNYSDDFLTLDQAAQLVGLSHWTVRSWLHKGLLTRYKSGFRTLVSRVELFDLTKVTAVTSSAPQARSADTHE